MHIVKDCLHYSSLETWIFFNNMIIYNFILISVAKRKTMELWFQFLHIHNEFKEG
jgi:hypothetical protein